VKDLDAAVVRYETIYNTPKGSAERRLTRRRPGFFFFLGTKKQKKQQKNQPKDGVLRSRAPISSWSRDFGDTALSPNAPISELAKASPRRDKVYDLEKTGRLGSLLEKAFAWSRILALRSTSIKARCSLAIRLVTASC